VLRLERPVSDAAVRTDFDPRRDSLAACALTLAIRLVWPGPVVAETAVGEDASAKVGVEPGQSSGGPSLLD